MHKHCESCYSRRCRAQVEAGVCCALVACRLHCGALFHSCKEEGHLLLCPCAHVPCLNAAYGCPVRLPRAQLATHLQACPASVVVCCVEWNRWPAIDAHWYPSPDLHRNLMGKCQEGACQDLDLALALKDQKRLFRSLKMKKLFPELTRCTEEEDQEEERMMKEEKRKKQEKKATLEKEAASKIWESFSPFQVSVIPEDEHEDEEETEEEVEELSEQEWEPQGVSEARLRDFNAWESMYSMAMGGCREAGRGQQEVPGVAEKSGVAAEGAHACRVSPLSHLPPEKKALLYNHVEPMKIVAVRTFKVPSSFSAKQGRIRNPGFYRRDHKAVDTSDLQGASENMPVWEEVQASLLCSLEKEQRGHLIAETLCTDGLLQDEGTQTFQFLSAPFASVASLADLTAGRQGELHLQLQLENVSSRHHKASSAFTAVCGHAVRRREYAAHYKNVHSDIQMNVNGWFQHRCPLAYLGCTFSQTRFTPSTHQASVVFTGDLGCFQLRPVSLSAESHVTSCDALSSLPFELLCHVATFLDSLSLSQLALVSRLMREVCSTLLPTRGMVSLRWERTARPEVGVRWSAKHKVWHFSSTFSAVDTWKFRDIPSMSEHLGWCPYFERERRSERFLLPLLLDDKCRHQRNALKARAII
ncbi:F-box only protein 40-like [Syngnathus typhle]|uniref:F-box only protein 40-like n=1 Tax=Syngnathus typhle TaxID=161592 RepID=UPI002A6A43D9|nr:F-box only protein 40-like [Syngnathus typhle]XP_061155051.1 F-box only protein 40-like [Syngnathus typhle]